MRIFCPATFVPSAFLPGSLLVLPRPPRSGVSAHLGAPHHTSAAEWRWPGAGGPAVRSDRAVGISRFGSLDHARHATATPSEQPDDSGRHPAADQVEGEIAVRKLTVHPSA